jgi:hypothetical protein
MSIEQQEFLLQPFEEAQTKLRELTREVSSHRDQINQTIADFYADS